MIATGYIISGVAILVFIIALITVIIINHYKSTDEEDMIKYRKISKYLLIALVIMLIIAFIIYQIDNYKYLLYACFAIIIILFTIIGIVRSYRLILGNDEKLNEYTKMSVLMSVLRDLKNFKK